MVNGLEVAKKTDVCAGAYLDLILKLNHKQLYRSAHSHTRVFGGLGCVQRSKGDERQI